MALSQKSKYKPKLVGGIGEKKSNGGRQYYQQDRIYDANEVAMCIPSQPNGWYWYKMEKEKYRRLTPRECWRLMAFDDESFNRAEKVCSQSDLYKQAGNSIVVDVLYYIFKEMIEENNE